MPLNKIFIVNKLNIIKNYLAELGNVFEFSNEEILKDGLKLHTAERLFQLIVDAVIDVNHHFIRELKLKIEEDLQSTFSSLVEGKILPQDLSDRMSPSVGQRNLIVHGYEKLDKNLFMKNLRNGYNDFYAYIEFINRYLDKSEDLKD